MSKLVSGLSKAYDMTPTAFKQNASVEVLKLINEHAGNLLGAFFDILNSEDAAILMNPMFVGNGHDGESPATLRYMEMKKIMSMGSSIVTGLGDIGGITSGLQGTAYSLMWYKLNALYEKLIPPSRRAKKVEYAAWYSWTVAKKAVPGGSLEALLTAAIRQKMYGAVGSFTKAGVTFGTGGVTGYLVNSATAAWIGPYLDSKFGQDTQTIAKALHWFGYLEKVVGRGVGKGPSRKILDVVWTEVALGKTSGVTLDDIIPEPCGWLVIADLLS